VAKGCRLLRAMGFEPWQKRFESGSQFRQLDWAKFVVDGGRRRSTARGRAQLPIQILLEARQGDVESEELCREGTLASKFFRTSDPSLPGDDVHRSIIIGGLSQRQCR